MQHLGDRVIADAGAKLSRAERLVWIRQGMLAFRRKGRRWTAAVTDGEVARAREQLKAPHIRKSPRHTRLRDLIDPTPLGPVEPVLPKRSRVGKPVVLRDLLTDPSGCVYKELLSFAEEHASSFSLTLWPGWSPWLAYEAKRLLATLRRYTIDVRRTMEWPGTALMIDSATLLHYRVCRGSFKPLRAAASLFDWAVRAGDSPGDLAFYVSTRRSRAGTKPRLARHDCWLGCVAHERSAFVRPDLIDVAALRSQVPGFKLGRPYASDSGGLHFWLEER